MKNLRPSQLDHWLVVASEILPNRSMKPPRGPSPRALARFWCQVSARSPTLAERFCLPRSRPTHPRAREAGVPLPRRPQSPADSMSEAGRATARAAFPDRRRSGRAPARSSRACARCSTGANAPPSGAAGRPNRHGNRRNRGNPRRPPQGAAAFAISRVPARSESYRCAG